MKICTKCGAEKAEGEFFRNKNAPDGLKWDCKACCLKRRRQKHKENPAIAKEQGRRWREVNLEKTKEYQRNATDSGRGAAYARNWRKKNRLAHNLSVNNQTAKKRGYVPCSVTIKELEASFTGRCFICGVPELECAKHLSMDHDHETGEFRGWLCPKCNHALGLFGDNEKIIESAIRYLTKDRVR